MKANDRAANRRWLSAGAPSLIGAVSLCHRQCLGSGGLAKSQRMRIPNLVMSNSRLRTNPLTPNLASVEELACCFDKAHPG